MDFSSLSDDDLIRLVLSLHDSIYVSECFGSKDVLMYEKATDILYKRGYEVDRKVQSRLSIGRRSVEDTPANN
jgi:hypothetical protein